MEIKKISYTNFDLYYIPNKKYKTFIMGIYFLNAFDKNDSAKKWLLSNTLIRFNEVYPTEKALSSYIRDLYGLSLYSDFGRFGFSNFLKISINSINDKYLDNEEGLFEKIVQLFNDIITKPLFDEELIELEKSLLVEDLERSFDNKSKYASKRFNEEMYKNESFKYNCIGTVEELKNVTVDDIKEIYNQIKYSKKLVYLIGDFDLNRVEKAFSKLSIEPSIDEDLKFIDDETKLVTQVNEVIEEQSIRQSIVLMGYRSGVRNIDESFFKMVTLSSMLGSYFHSSLFQEIREKRSLAYSISTSYNSIKGDIVVFSRISANNYEEYKEVVMQIINEYKNGFFEDEILELTKKSLINDLYIDADKTSVELQHLMNEIRGIKNYTVEEKVEIINNITKEDIIEVANLLVLDTIYLLKGTL